MNYHLSPVQYNNLRNVKTFGKNFTVTKIIMQDFKKVIEEIKTKEDLIFRTENQSKSKQKKRQLSSVGAFWLLVTSTGFKPVTF
ncbi:hypothetical protein FGO68_gene13793 [Halteria grandinella]|uniref:Uncharacterized protein n=1 Tax=Halteria grandinella TaxID=5974 RepID=A0A8J8NB78_HALGN|nr:hypothetical protein FGO68_gene13793 [Halteria grandinella]